MSYSNNEALYRQIIMDHYQNPRNNTLSKETGFVNIAKNNPSCGDSIVVQLKFNKNIVEKVNTEGSGCSICCASASMMTELFQNKTIEEVENITKQFENMLFMLEFEADVIEEAIALNGVSKLPPRIKCATLSWSAALDAIVKYKENQND